MWCPACLGPGDTAFEPMHPDDDSRCAASYSGEALGSYPRDTGFESLAAHAGVRQLADLASSNLVACALDSRLPYPMGNGVTRQHA
jgi:hypothetical protein